MNEILHANIFFIIASVATIVFSILISVALYHGIKILRAVRKIVDRVEAGSAIIAEDIDTLRATIYEGGIVTRVVNLFFSRFMGGNQTEKATRPTRSSFKKINNTHGTEKND